MMDNARVVKILDVLSYVFILISVVIMPLFLDTSLVNFFIIPKQYVFIGLVLFNILFFAAKMVVSKKLQYRHSVLDMPLVIFLLLSLVSALFSGNAYNSFLGRGEFFLLSFVFLCFSVLFYFVFVNYVNTPRRWSGVMDAVLATAGLSAALFILKVVFSFDLPVVGAVWNVFDPSNSQFGVWMVAIAVLSAGLLMKKNINVGRALFYFFILILSVIPLLTMGFKFLWWLLLIGLVLLLLLGVSFIHSSRIGWMSALFAMLVITCVFVIFGSPRSLQTALPAEVSLGLSPSWSITKNTVFAGAKNFLFGSGLGSFGTDFSRYRVENFNYDTIAWSLRFSQPFNTIFALLAEGGVLLSIAFLFVLLLVLGHVFTTWSKARGSSSSQDLSTSLYMSKQNLRLDVFLAVVVWLVLWCGMTVGFYNPALWYVWWLFLAVIISGLYLLGHGVLKEKHWTMEDTPQYHLAFSFSVIVVMAVVVLVWIIGVRFYMAEKNYAQAVKAPDYETAQEKISRAVSLRGGYDLYHVSLANVYLNRAGQLSRKSQPDVQAVADMVARAVNEAKLATDLSPNTVGIWENLATMYENATLLVPEANEWAIKSLNTAIELEPTNAFLRWRLGNAYITSNNLTKSIESYKKAIELKEDYLAAYAGLASAYEKNKQNDEAIKIYGQARNLSASNPELLFNLGRLLYNRGKEGDRAAAEQLWLSAINIQPNYSNALYSLGIYYENIGDKAKALQYYYKVKDLNPENKDITAKIKGLVGR